jgi:DedD protein
MAERIADDADLAVDELKRRARRRLIGAIVLALAAAVILPLLLEKDPKPLGDDVSVQIPPVDEGRFVNRLTGRSGDAKGIGKPDTRPLPKSVPTKIETPPVPPPASESPPAPAADGAPTTAAPTEVAPPRKSVAEAEQKVLAGGKSPAAPKPETRIAAAPAATPAPAAPAPLPATPAPAIAEGFAVQIAAFTDDKGANALAAKLRKAGYEAAYVEPAETSRGTMWRVRVGGFATRQDADAARAKLKGDGWNGLVVSAQ